MKVGPGRWSGKESDTEVVAGNACAAVESSSPMRATRGSMSSCQTQMLNRVNKARLRCLVVFSQEVPH